MFSADYADYADYFILFVLAMRLNSSDFEPKFRIRPAGRPDAFR